jgi:hypothetical protein
MEPSVLSFTIPAKRCCHNARLGTKYDLERSSSHCSVESEGLPKRDLTLQISHKSSGEKIRTQSVVTQVGYPYPPCLIWYLLSRKSPINPAIVVNADVNASKS